MDARLSATQVEILRRCENGPAEIPIGVAGPMVKRYLLHCITPVAERWEGAYFILTKKGRRAIA